MENRRTTLLALAAVLLTLGSLWYIQRPVIPREATLADVQAEAVRGGYCLITTEALAHNLGLSLRGATFIISKLQREGKLS